MASERFEQNDQVEEFEEISRLWPLHLRQQFGGMVLKITNAFDVMGVAGKTIADNSGIYSNQNHKVLDKIEELVVAPKKMLVNNSEDMANAIAMAMQEVKKRGWIIEPPVGPNQMFEFALHCALALKITVLRVEYGPLFLEQHKNFDINLYLSSGQQKTPTPTNQQNS